jgi:ABC-type polysaccharide/polyol phosphate export permease
LRGVAAGQLTSILTALGLAFGVALASKAFDDDSVWPALVVGIVAWATLSATTLLQHNAFELKPRQLTLLNNAYQLVLFLVMALIIGLM